MCLNVLLNYTEHIEFLTKHDRVVSLNSVKKKKRKKSVILVAPK